MSNVNNSPYFVDNSPEMNVANKMAPSFDTERNETNELIARTFKLSVDAMKNVRKRFNRLKCSQINVGLIGLM